MASVIKLACKYCGQGLNIPAPQQAGVYTITCPFCQGQMKVKYNPKPITVAQPAQSTPMSIPTQPTPMSFPGQPTPMSGSNAQHNPTRRFNNTPGAMPFSAPTPQPQQASAGMSAGRLSLVRLGCDKEYFPLHIGDNIIGRKDYDQPSDVAIEGDLTMSRRSVKLTVSPMAGGCSYMLTVLKAANPVLINGAAVAIGQTVPLTMGASIFMGQTMLRLEK